MINIFYTSIKEPLLEGLYDDYLSCLPIPFQEKNVKFRRWQDRHSNLFGKLLLLAGLKSYGYTSSVLHEIQYNQYTRPFIDGNLDFNISHSGEYVLCAIGKNTRLGVDVEEIKEINFDDFKKVMTPEQWRDIIGSENPTRTFFKYWTIKESVIKADSRGLSIPLLNIHVKDDKVSYDNQIWYLEELKLDNRYRIFLASDKENVECKLQFIDFYKIGERNQKTGDRSRELITNDKLLTTNE